MAAGRRFAQYSRISQAQVALIITPVVACRVLNAIIPAATNLAIMNQAPAISHAIVTLDARRLPPMVGMLAAFFRSRGITAYLVGGVVRDALTGWDADDIDIAIDADAARVGRELADALGGHHYARLHEDWQIARVALNGEEASGYIDITTIQSAIEQDLRRRDFTINAMALPLDAASGGDIRGELLDPCGGAQDLEDGVVRMTSPAVLEQDCVRLMRGVRLASRLGFAIEPDTASAIRRNAACLATAPQERVRDELMRILQTPNARDGVRMLDDLGLLCSVMPELAVAKGVAQPKEHYWDVFNHLVEAVGWVDAMFSKRADVYPLSLVPRFEGMDDYFGGDVSDGFDRLTFLKLTALLHDIAKPATKTVEASGRIRFLGHHTEGADIVRQTLMRLRFGNRGVEHVARMVRRHLQPTQMAQKGEMPTARALYRYYRNAGDVAPDTLYLNIADYLAARGPMLGHDDWAYHCALIRHILEAGRAEDAPQSVPALVNGYDIMDRFALAPSPAVGRLLRMVREAQASGEVTTRAQALDLVSSGLERGGDGA